MKAGNAVRIGATIVVAAVSVVAAAGAAGAGPPVLGGKIAYMSMRDGQADIFSMDADGKAQFNITHDGSTDVRLDVEPAWSPDGKQVAFERQYTQPHRGAILMIVKADGTKLRTLVPPALREGSRSSQPSWSPDGGAVVFTSNRDGNFELYVIKSNGQGLKQLTFTKNSVRSFEPQWSPDGRTILFSRSGTSASTVPQAHLYLLKLESGAVVQLTRSPSERGAGDETPAWSPNGTRIAFTSDRMGSNDIYVMRSDGSSMQRVTMGRSNDNHPTWASDGRTLAFVSDRTGSTEIFTFSAATQEPTQLTHDKALKADPTWQRILNVSVSGIAG
jgi:Tol biopolymer transport system component